AHPVLWRNRRRGRKARHLGQRVHARIGPAGALGQYIFPAQPSNGRGQRALHGRPAGLHLPAGEVCAIVRKDQFEIAHVLVESWAKMNPRVSRPPSREVRRPVSYTISLTATFTYDP